MAASKKLKENLTSLKVLDSIHFCLYLMFLLLIKNRAVDEAPEDSTARGTVWVGGPICIKY